MDKEKVAPVRLETGRGSSATPPKSEDISDVVFYSLDKELMIFRDEHVAYRFTNHSYRPKNKDELKFLSNHPLLDKVFWLGKFPDWVIKKFKEDKQYLTYNTEDFMPAEE